MTSIISSPMEINNKSKMLCENELEMLLNCKKANFQYCFILENLYKDCLKFKKNKEKQKKRKNLQKKKLIQK